MKINLLEYFESTVSKNGNKIAVIEGKKNVSFDQLFKKSIIISHEIVSQNDFINNPIAVYLPKSIDSIVSNMGITFSGNTYMNLDVKSPIERTKNIIQLIEPKVIITNEVYLTKIEEICPDYITLINIDKIDFNKVINKKDLLLKYSDVIDTDPYCIINTSGSTGTPKGVVLNHRSFIDFTEWAIKNLNIGDSEIIGSLSPLVFDIYSFELCMLMTKGSTIVILPESLAAFPAKLLTLMQDHEVSFIFWVPTIMVNISNMDLLSKVSLNKLKSVWFAGEVFPTKQFNYWKEHIENAMFVNLYGPIEITLDCTYYIVERDLQDNEPIPIGYPCRNTDVLILNEENKLVKGNEEGELCVRGSSLAMGYYNNPEKTSLAFTQNPLNNSYPEIIYRTGDIVFYNDRGEIVFKGRIDSLVKHQGYRIELGEIEHVIINTLKLVENGCVVYNKAKKEITLFYESKNELSIADFKKAIGSVLPKYMVPTRYHEIELLPRNTNGKIDRLQLLKKISDE